MQKRKLQVFLSSTYEDLVDQRLAAMEAILAAGHIPAAMEQFSAGDETALERIKTWIDESDAFVLILGGRYGSVDPESGKSYVQLEYEYAVDKKKPFFAIVVSKEHHEERVKQWGLSVDEREHQENYKQFWSIVTQKLCASWNDNKDIKAAILHKLPEWAQRSDLVGWVRGDDVASPEVMNELARLSRENNELRVKVGASSENFSGLSFEELVRLLREVRVSEQEAADVFERLHIEPAVQVGSVNDLLLLFDAIYDDGACDLIRGVLEDRPLPLLSKLVGFGLLERGRNYDGNQIPTYNYYVTATGHRLRIRFLAYRPVGRRADGCD
jgi:nucleoside 2-deoxyribosyltransferase